MRGSTFDVNVPGGRGFYVLGVHPRDLQRFHWSVLWPHHMPFVCTFEVERA